MGLALPIVNSDQSPLVLTPNLPARCARYFKYESYFEENTQCREVVEDGWKSNEGLTDIWENLDEKVKNCKRNLSSWDRKTFKNAAVDIQKLKLKLQNLLNNNGSYSNCDEIKRIRVEIDGPWRQEEMYWGQCSRLKWLEYGDRNSKFFHITTIKIRDTNRLSRIKNKDGEWVEG